MALAAALAATGTRPASFVPTVKCSSCGDEIEISAMGEHQCPAASPKAAPASLSNPFTLRQLNAMETRPSQPSPLQFSGSETKPAQPSPLQFDANDRRPTPPNPQQYISGPPQSRPRAPTAGSNGVPIIKAPRTAPPRINPDAANQPFLGPPPHAPASPASSIRSVSSGSSKATQPKRQLTAPMPRLFDPRPPSPELSANLDCAFPPFPPSVPASRKMSTGSQGSARSGLRPEAASLEPRSPMGRPGEGMGNKLNPSRDPFLDRAARRPSNEDRSPSDFDSGSNKTSQNSTPMTPLEEFPQRPNLAPLQTNLPAIRTTSSPSPAPESGLHSLMRKFSQKRLRPAKPAKPEEPVPLLQGVYQARTPQQVGPRKAPPERPVRPEEGLPASLLNPMSPSPLSALSSLSPPPFPLSDLDRSHTLPTPASESDELTTAPALSKMASEPALRTMADLSNPPQSETAQEDTNEDPMSRKDYRMTDAPPVPKPVQVHRSESLHNSSESGVSTASSILSLGDMSMGNSNTTAGTSPVISAASSLDAFLPFTASPEKESAENGLRVVPQDGQDQRRPSLRAEPPSELPPLRPAASPLAAEVVQPEDEHSSDDEELAPPSSLPTSPTHGNWPLESPMDPALKSWKLGDEPQESLFANQSPIEPLQPLLVPSSPKLERLSNAVYDPKRACSPQPSPKDVREEEQQQRQSQDAEQPEQQQPSHLRMKSDASADDEFQGFNFGTAFATQPRQPDSASSSPKASNSTPSAISEPAPADSSPPPPSPPQPILPPEAPPIPESIQRPALVRRSTTGTKAVCRGCHQQIEGKSVKAADGRLTGRWHKACFVCQTCKSQFETADFYVINNNPYCEQHYHEKNGSLCHGCQRGIEGQFLETISGPGGRVVRKYHRRCFTCVDCRVILSEDYFEIAGRVHCERHALAAMRSQARRAPAPGGAPALPYGSSGLRAESFKAERRRTRLMQS